MEIYLDTGNVDEIREVAELGLLDGVTTNPTLIAKEGKNFKEVILEIISILKKNCADDFTVSAEVTDLTDLNSILKQARELSKIDKHILVKIPLTLIGLRAVSILSAQGIRCNVTLCFSANQALLAAKAGAWCVSPFIGRLDDIGENGLHLIHEIKEIFENFGAQTKILGASIRNVEHVKNCALIGCDIVTVPYGVYKKMYFHNLTYVGLEKFKNDWNEYLDSVKK